jgi:LPXTG-motif cell wall-anchored protein
MQTTFTVAAGSAGTPATLPKTGEVEATLSLSVLALVGAALLLLAGVAVWLRSRQVR